MKTVLIQTIRRIAQKLYKKYKANSTQNPVSSAPPTQAKPVEPVKPMESVESKPSISVDISETPNPHACKYDVSVKVSEKSFSFSQANKPEDHSLANALLSVEGVDSVFGVHTFITATKSQTADWDDIHPKITAVLQKILSESSQ